jgi:hypothetical protein
VPPLRGSFCNLRLPSPYPSARAARLGIGLGYLIPRRRRLILKVLLCNVTLRPISWNSSGDRKNISLSGALCS